MTSLSICLWCENGWKKEQCCNFDRKLKIIEDLRGGKSQHFMADLYKMPKSTVGDIWKDRDKIEHFVSTSACPSFAKKRCIVRDAKFDELDKACSEDPGYQLLTDTEIVAEVTGEKEDSDSGTDDEMVPQELVSHAQAFNAFETSLRWLEAQPNIDPFHLLLVRKWRDCAAQKEPKLKNKLHFFLIILLWHDTRNCTCMLYCMTYIIILSEVYYIVYLRLCLV
jgi:hypothetical protein